MFYMFNNYNNLLPKIKCIYKKTLYTFVFPSRTKKFYPICIKRYKKAPVPQRKQRLSIIYTSASLYHFVPL